MNSAVQQEIELSAVLNLVPYLDIDFDSEMSLSDIIDKVEANGEMVNDKGDKIIDSNTYKILKNAVDSNPEYGKITLVDQSSTNNTDPWSDDLIQGCTFKDGDGNYYVAFRGTGEGRWPDNGDGMIKPSTEMQEAAQKYFDEMAAKYFVEADAEGKRIIVTGHSKGGNEAQYVYMTSEYEYLIDNCYNYDGQGFSDIARKNFEEKYGPDYEEKLSRMYSICGENDYVHDLGYVIVPEENTYFVGTSGEGFVSYHLLEAMLSEEGEYNGLHWTVVDGQIVNGEQGEVGKFAKKLSEIMMELDDENLHGAAVAIMTLMDWDEEILGTVSAEWTDYVDLVAHGLPAILEVVLLTEEGHEFLGELIKTGVDIIYEKFGVIGVVAAVALVAVAVVSLAPVIFEFVSDVIVLAKKLDYIIDTVKAIMEISSEVYNCLMLIKEATLSTVKAIFLRLISVGDCYKYASSNPEIIVDTSKLEYYAQSINSLNTRISKLDRRIDDLYWRVGLLDLWNLMQADALISYSWKLNRCSSYLNETARDFINAENELTNKIQ